MNLFEKWDKIIEGGLQRVVHAALGPGVHSDFLESYSHALEDIEAQIQSIGGRLVFPYKRVMLKFFIFSAEQVPALGAILAQRRQLSIEIRRRLRESGCESPSALRIDASVQSPVDQSDLARGYELSYGIELPPQPCLTITVLKGQAEESYYSLSERTVNIGRLREVQDELKRLIRRNQVIFNEAEQGVNSTVSRTHAHISFDDDSGWFRVYDDASKFGTRIHREGQVIEIPKGPGGAWLRSGDEVHLGQARISVEFSEQ